MTEKRADQPANQNLPLGSARPTPVPIDVQKHIRAREAVKTLLDRQKSVFVQRKTFSSSGMEARIMVGGKYYDVNQRELAAIREGASPEDCGVEEVAPHEYDDD